MYACVCLTTRVMFVIGTAANDLGVCRSETLLLLLEIKDELLEYLIQLAGRLQVS